MVYKDRDISPEARKFYRMLREKPALFLGCECITFLRTYMDGMLTADRLFNGTKNIIIPYGFTDFVEWYYGDNTCQDCFECVLKAEGDEKAALEKWFSLLDEYLKGLGYEPIGITKKG